MATHSAVVATGVQNPLIIEQFQLLQLRITKSGFGDSAAGTVVEVGPDVKHYKVGDRVTGFFFHNEREKTQQIYVTAPEHLFAKVPKGVSLAAAATLPNNFCAVFITLFDKFGVDLPWPRPDNFTLKQHDEPILIWGGASSIGQYALQILKHCGYTNVISTASPKHHDKLKSYGAKHVFVYRDANIVESIGVLLKASNSAGIRVFDCVASKTGSLLSISKIAVQSGSIVAAVLPVVISAPSTEGGLQLSGDVATEADWASGVDVHSIVSYAYEANEFLRENLQPSIMTTLLAQGVIEPNQQQIIKGKTILERAQTALDTLKSGTVSGERLVWQVWSAEEFPKHK